MFKNYLTVAIRNIARYKVYSFINIAGLAIGMACCALILMYVQHELSYDTFHSKGDRIYRVLRKVVDEKGEMFYPSISGVAAPEVLKDLPEVASVARVYGNHLNVWAKNQDRLFAHAPSSFFCADQEMFEVFDFELTYGDEKTVLQEPFSMIITEKMARRYFEAENPVGEIISTETHTLPGDYRVTGVVKVPENSSIKFDMIVSSATPSPDDRWFNRIWNTWDSSYFVNNIQTYVVLHKEADVREVERKLYQAAVKHMNEELRDQLTYVLQPLTRMHLYTQDDYGLLGWTSMAFDYGNIDHIYLFSGIAALIMLIACVNFMNLATARSANRAKEVGMRKVSGAYRFQLIRQFLGEALLLSFLSFVLAAGLVELMLPHFTAFVGKEISAGINANYYLIIPLLVVCVGFLAGSYPAFFLSAFEAVSVLKGSLKTGLKGAVLKRGLVVFQFAISILLIIGTVTIYRQLEYMQNQDLGFDTSRLIQMPVLIRDLEKTSDRMSRLVWRHNTVKQAFLKHPNILEATAFRHAMGSGNITRQIVLEDGSEHQIYSQQIDEDFLSVFGLELVLGRNFRDVLSLDENDQVLGDWGVILNETAVEKLGLEDPLSKSIRYFPLPHSPFPILGVVKDFHHQSLHKKIAPLFLINSPQSFSNLGVKVRSENLPETLAFLEKTWHTFLPDRPFEYEFVDDHLSQLYQQDQKVGQLVGTFAGLAILVACLGLFGLAAYTAEQRTKEIGVRKVLGASVRGIVVLLSMEFAKLVLVANLIAWPVAYFAVGDWLQNFAYRVDLTWWVFALGGLLALVIALSTVAYQAIKAALANPIEALRYE